MQTTKKEQSYSNEHIEFQMEHLPQCIVKVKGVLKKEAIGHAKQNALKEIGKHASIPGFRKGKVPAFILEKNFSKEIFSKTKELALQKVLLETLILSKLRILQTHPTVKNEFNNFSLNEAAPFLLEFQTEASVPDIDLSKLKIKGSKPEPVTKEQIEDMIERMRQYFATFNSVDRPIKKDDFADLDIYDEEQKRILFNDKRFQASIKTSAQWIVEALIGKKAGDTFQQTSELDKDAPAEVKKQFKPTKCKITVKKVYEAILPPVDDAFCKKVGSNNVEDLYKNAQRMLEGQAEQKAKDDGRAQLIEAILKNHPFDVPQAMVKAQGQVLLNELLSRMYDQNALDKNLVERRKTLEEDAQKEAKKMIQTYLITQKLAQKENVQIGQEELVSHLLKVTPQEAMHALNDPNQKEKRDQMVQDAIVYLTQIKVLDLLIEKIEKN
jgi:trigger factor